MEYGTVSASIVVYIINVFNIYIIFAYSKVWNINDNFRTVFTVELGSVYLAAVYFDNKSACSISHRNSHGNVLDFLIGYILCHYNNTGIGRADSELSMC